MIRVIVAEDSPTMRQLLVHILNAEPDVEVIAAVVDGLEAMDAVARLQPDVVTMDVHMPRMDGFEAARNIMETNPVPIVIVSGTLTDQLTATFRALEVGALAFVPRPEAPGHPRHDASAADLTDTVRLMSEVKVVRRWRKGSGAQSRAVAPAAAATAPSDAVVIAIGASTGGPQALQTILARLPKGYPLPVLVVQHMAPGFVHGMAEWLASSSPLAVQVAQAGEVPRAGHAYLAPDGCHMGLGEDGRIFLNSAAAEYGLRPSVAWLFRSVTKAAGARAIGVLLSGMGKDGAAELKGMRDAGAFTIVQSKETSVVHGMPGEAIVLGGAAHVLAPEEIAGLLAGLATKRSRARASN